MAQRSSQHPTQPPQQPEGTVTTLVKPRLRGVSHQYAAYIALPAGLLLTSCAHTRKAAIGSLVYAASLVVLFSISALYHRPTWQPQQRKWMRRLDHSAIFFLIAGTYTPICLLALPGRPGEQLLLIVWTGAFTGILQSLFWVSAPKVLVTALYVLLGWAGVRSVGQLRDTGVLLVACGGLSYTVGGMHLVSNSLGSPEHAYTVCCSQLGVCSDTYRTSAAIALLLKKFPRSCVCSAELYPGVCSCGVCPQEAKSSAQDFWIP